MRLIHIKMDVTAQVNDEELTMLLSPDNSGCVVEGVIMDDNIEWEIKEVSEVPNGSVVVDWTHPTDKD